MQRDRNNRLLWEERGLTLIEMLVSTAIFAVVAGGVYLLYESMLGTYTKGEMRSEVQQSARIALAQFSQDLRGAGYDPSGAIPAISVGPTTVLRAAMPACLSFISYGASGGSQATVQISYALNGSDLRRRVDPWNPGPPGIFTAGSWGPVAHSITSMQFTYYDAEGSLLASGTEPPAGWCPPSASGPAPPTDQLSVEQMRRVRRIGVTLRVERAAPRLAPEVFVLSNDVYLRNR